MQPVTVGTAGHIDHGKSALVRALTGVDPDRLAEEQRRGMTLDLGFAHLDLPSGRRIGIVDVPGHEALIHNMLAGAGGIDLVMLVVAADEGAMPQTREHLDILRFLRLRGGVIVLTKIDLVSDPEWIAAVQDDLARLIAGTVLEDAPVVRVSARTGAGLPDLVATLDRLVATVPLRPADGPVRLPIDRSFTMQGFGTVVTGTLWSGTIRAGDQLTVLPDARDVRVRGVQVHSEAVPAASAGSRVAVNLSGLEKDDVARGDVLVTPGAFRPTERLDVRLRLLPGAVAVRHSSRLHVYLGAGATVGRVALVDRARLEPGAEGLAQLRLERPVVAVHGDRFVVRRYSPPQTLGGGVVLDAAPPARRRGTRTAEALEAVDQAGPSALVVAAVAARGQVGMVATDAAAAAGLDGPSAAGALKAALADGRLMELDDRVFARSIADDVQARVEGALRSHHERMPWRLGMPKEDLKSHIAGGGGDRLFDATLDELRRSGRVADRRGLIILAGHTPRVTEADQRVRAALLASIERNDASPPTLDDLHRLGDHAAVDRMLQALIDDGAIVHVNPELRFAAPAVERVRGIVVEMLQSGREVTVATLRDRLQTSRKYALALLEYLDSVRVTRRVGDRRVLGARSGEPLGPAR